MPRPAGAPRGPRSADSLRLRQRGASAQTGAVEAGCERLYQLPFDRLVGQHVFEAIAGTREQVGPILHSVLDTGRAFEASAFPLAHTVDGHTRNTLWDVTFDPIVDAQGAVSGLVWLSIEVSDRIVKERLLNDQLSTLRRAYQLKDELLSLVSHDLRTPIHALMGFGRLLEKGRAGEPNPQQLGYVKKMLGVAEHLGLIVQDILNMSHLQAGTLPIEIQPTGCATAIERVVAELMPLALEKHQVLDVALEPDLPAAGAKRVRQVLTNLLSNALKFTPDGGHVTVRAKLTDGVMRCDVQDTGPGLSREDVPKLFKPFTQIDMSSTRQGGHRPGPQHLQGHHRGPWRHHRRDERAGQGQ